MKPIHAVLLFLASFCVQQGTSNGALLAQESFGNFAWQKGQTFRYQVEHKTTASDKQGTTTSEVKTELNLLKEWKVLAVDPDGTAQIQLKLLALRSVTKKPDGNCSPLIPPNRNPPLHSFVIRCQNLLAILSRC